MGLDTERGSIRSLREEWMVMGTTDVVPMT